MELVIGDVLIAIAAFVGAIKLWMVHHAARLTDQDRGVGMASGVFVPTTLLMIGIYCIDASDRRLWFTLPMYFASAAGLALVLLGTNLALRAYGHRIRTGRWSRHRK